MNTLYRIARVSVTGEGPSSQVAIQRKWLRDTELHCIQSKTPEYCVALNYYKRNNELAISSLFGEHDVASQQLTAPRIPLPNDVPAVMRADRPEMEAKERVKRLKAATVYEAIYRYATIDSRPARVKLVTPLVAPLFAEFIKDAWKDPLGEAQQPADVVASDESFAGFVAMASVSIDDADFRLPCAALLRRPGLISMLQAYYGGAIDGRLAITSCASDTTRLPTFDALVQDAFAAQDECAGTIRFSLGRNTERVLTAVRLGLTDTLRSDARQSRRRMLGPWPEDLWPQIQKFIASHGDRMAAAQREVAAYYAAAFHEPKDVSETDAVFAVKSAIAAIFDGCETG